MKLSFQPAGRLPRWPWWAVAVVAAWSGLVATEVYLSHRAGVEVTLCMFKRLTHLPCPTCGGTRGTLAILDGRVGEAFSLNPLLFTLLMLAAGHLLFRATFARRLHLDATPRQRAALWIAFAALVLANWAYLIARGM